jgi:serine/threonine-protein kinase
MSFPFAPVPSGGRDVSTEPLVTRTGPEQGLPLSLGRDTSRFTGRRSALLALPFGSTPLDSEEGRDFLQRRLRLFSKAVFLLSIFSFVATQLIQLAIPDHEFWTCMKEHGGLWHLFSASVSAAVWLVARGRRLPFRALLCADVAGTLLALGGYAMMSLASAPHATDRVSLVMMLVTLCMVTLRAVIIPSTLVHTLLVGGIGSIPVLGLAYYTAVRFPSTDANLSPFVSTGYMVVWVTLGMVISGLASQVIYGLRAQVMRAQRLGQYVLDEKIGEGGMGIVFKARHALLRRPTAIKLVLPERAGVQLLLRFEREVQLTARLTHPNTVSIFDYGRTPDGIFYYAMEYLDGINLEELVDRFGPQPPSRVAHILEQVLGSLAEAHSVGLVHRDIKPANVILVDRGGVPDTAKVVDFGLVKDVSDLGRGKVTLSSVNAIIGTPLYLAPEAITDPEQVDGRADLYALGAVAYFLLTGRPVFTGASVVEVCAQHLHAEPSPPSLHAPEPVPPELESIILRCLAKQPSARPASAVELLRELSESSIPRWRREQAAAWWQAHGAEARSRVPATDHDVAVRDTVLVDLAGRATEPRKRAG